MLGRFEKNNVVRLPPKVRIPFKLGTRRVGVVRFAYDHDQPAYDVEFFQFGRSLGTLYLAYDELEPLLLQT
jgi:hypothetical protein